MWTQNSNLENSMDIVASMSSKEKAKVLISFISFAIKIYILKYFFITGVSIYVKEHLGLRIQPWHTTVINNDSYQLLKIKLEHLSIMGVYRSPSHASQGKTKCSSCSEMIFYNIFFYFRWHDWGYPEFGIRWARAHGYNGRL